MHVHRDGFVLVEVLVVLLVLAVVAVPLAGLAVSTLRTVSTTQRLATGSSLAMSTAALVPFTSTPDPCTPGTLAGDIAGRLDVPDGWALDVVPDCTTPGVVLASVVVTDPTGRESLASAVLVEVTP